MCCVIHTMQLGMIKIFFLRTGQVGAGSQFQSLGATTANKWICITTSIREIQLKSTSSVFKMPKTYFMCYCFALQWHFHLMEKKLMHSASSARLTN